MEQTFKVVILPTVTIVLATMVIYQYPLASTVSMLAEDIP
jgi:hypothetical protein